ncbi:MAG: hypothetical protein ACX930_06660 [Erythrobacter sp.]
MTARTNFLAGARAIVTVGAACVLLTGCNVSREQEAAQIERDILATPGQQQLWRTIKDEYPQDFDTLIAQLQALDFDERRDEGRIEAVGTDWLLNFLDRIAPSAVIAPPAEILSWSETERDLYAVLQRGAVDECAAMTMGQPITVQRSNAAASAAIARRNLAFVQAAAAGRRDPQDYAEPDEADWARLGDAIAATGLDPELQETLGSEEAMLALTRAQQCEIGVALFQGIADLPDDVEPEMAAFMLAPE